MSNKKNFFAMPSEFSQSPIMSFLPHVGEVSKLFQLYATFYARYEKVKTLKENQDLANQEEQRRLLSEELMLKQVLDWTAGNEAYVDKI